MWSLRLVIANECYQCAPSGWPIRGSRSARITRGTSTRGPAVRHRQPQSGIRRDVQVVNRLYVPIPLPRESGHCILTPYRRFSGHCSSLWRYGVMAQRCSVRTSSGRSSSRDAALILSSRRALSRPAGGGFNGECQLEIDSVDESGECCDDIAGIREAVVRWPLLTC